MSEPTIYFAYGYLLDRQRLAELSPAAKPLTPARIPHHALCFTGHSARWGGGTATIVAATGSDLWGGLYEIDAAGRRALERSGVDDGYVWCLTAVETRDGARLHVGLLVKVRDLEVGAPADEYLAVLRAGWEQWGLDPQPLLEEASAPR